MSVDVPPERPGKTASLYSASDEDWAEAVRRAAIIRPLSEARRCSKAVVQAAAKSLGLSIPRTYRLVQDFRSRPLTASLLPLKRGRVKGSRRLDPKVEARVDEAVDAIYLKLERPTVKRLFGEVHRNCIAVGLKPPSMKALRARVAARSLREREG